MKSAWRFALLVFAGLILIQGAWIIAIPPFRGIDEFDHVFRAMGVADGQWRLSVDTPEGRGLLVAVPRDVVEAASDQCDDLEYTGRDNCFPVQELADGRVTVSTAAASYHPAYYFVVGSVGQFFDGAGVVYAMRVASSVIGAVGLGCAAFCLALSRARSWARFGFLVALTPVLAYTLTLPAPNSIEIVAGMCLWTSLLGFLGERGQGRHPQFFLLMATIAACVLGTVRLLGPMWLGMIVLTTAAWAGWTSVRTAVLRHRWATLAASAAVLLVISAGLWWSMTAQQFEVSGDVDPRERLDVDLFDLKLKPVVWLLQLIAAFPLRNEVAHPSVYAAYFIVVLSLLGVSVRRVGGRKRLLLVAVAIVVATLPILLTLATADSQGVIWQGRYGLPFAVGLTILCGTALDGTGFAPREGTRLRITGCAVLGFAHAVAVAHVVALERGRPVSVADPAWMAPHPYLVACLVAAGCVLWTIAIARPKGSATETRANRAMDNAQSNPGTRGR